MKIARVLRHPHSLVGDRAPTLWLPEQAIFKAMAYKGRGNLAPTACCAATMDLGTDEGVCPTDYGSIFIIGRPSPEGRPYDFWAQSASGGCPYHSVTERLPRRPAFGRTPRNDIYRGTVHRAPLHIFDGEAKAR